MLLLIVLLSSLALMLSIFNLMYNYVARKEIQAYKEMIEDGMRSDASAIAFLSTLNANLEAASRVTTRDDSADAHYK